jgi:hypothetical protein
VLRTKIPPRVHQNLTKDWKVITSVFVSRKREQMNRYSEEQSTTEYSVVSYESPGVIGHLARLTLQPLQRRYLPGTKEENTVVRNPHSQNRSQNRRRGRQRSTKRRDQRVEIRQHATRGSAPKSLASESNSAGLCRSWCSVRLNLGAVRCSACTMRIQGAAHNAQVVRSPVRRAETTYAARHAPEVCLAARSTAI